MNYKLFIPLAFVVLVVLYFLADNDAPKAVNEVQETSQEKATLTSVVPVIQPEFKEKSDNKINVSAELNSVAEFSEVDYSQEVHLNETDITHQNTPQLNYEDNWCNAHTQLNRSDYERSQIEINEFVLSRGGAKIVDFPGQMFSGTESLVNNEYVESYQEMPLQDLLELSQQGERMAMIALVQRNDASVQQRNSVARKLLVLGDTQYGLGQLVASQMDSASLRYKEKGGVDDEVKKHLMKALALVEYGVERKDLHALSVYLTYSGKENQRLFDLDPDTVLSEDDLTLIPEAKTGLWQEIEDERLANNLPSLQEEELPRMAHKRYEEGLALLHSIYPDYMENARILQRWRSTYLQKNDCVDDLIEFNQRRLDFLDYVSSPPAENLPE